MKRKKCRGEGEKRLKTEDPKLIYNLNGLKKPLSITDLRDIVLWCLTDEVANPNSLMFLNRKKIERVVLLHCPSFSAGKLNWDSKDLSNLEIYSKLTLIKSQKYEEPEFINGDSTKLPSIEVNDSEFAEIFPVSIPLYSPTGMNSVFHPAASMFKISKKMADSIPKKDEFRPKLINLMLTKNQMMENGFQLHPLQGTESDFVASFLEKLDYQEEKQMISMDCEMCLTAKGLQVTRISLLDQEGVTLLDTFVLPDDEITDYNTQYSGITEEHLKGVTVTLEEIQQKLKKIVKNNVVLVGHSLENDLNALRFVHPYIVDTSVCFKGQSDRKSSLRHLTSVHLNRKIQDSSLGHDSVEDARACLDLVKLLLTKGSKKADLFDFLNFHLKKTLFIDQPSSCETYAGSSTCFKSDNDFESMDIFEQNILNYDLIWMNLVEHHVEGTKFLYELCPKNTLFVVFSGWNANVETLKYLQKQKPKSILEKEMHHHSLNLALKKCSLGSVFFRLK